MVSSVPSVKSRSKQAIESLTEYILRDYKPDLLTRPDRFPIVDFFDHYIRKEYRLDTGVRDLPLGIEGITCPDGKVLVCEDTYRNACRHQGRSRFTIAHECGHGVMHHKEIKGRLIDAGELVLYRRTDLPAYMDPEWQANQFAGCLLMPRGAVEELARNNPRQALATRMVDKFGVSLAAANKRLQVLEIYK